MDIASVLDDLSPTDLRARGSLKWTAPEEGVLGAFVAESDLPIAPAIRSALNDALDRGLTGYLPEHLEAQAARSCAAFQDRRFCWHVDPASIHTLPDVLTGMTFTALHLAPAGTPIVVPTPAYMPFLGLPAGIGAELRTLPMDRVDGRYTIDPERLERSLRGGGLLVLVNPHNPTGQVATRDELLRIAEVVDRTGSMVFADEIHSPLAYPGATHLPYASLSDDTARHTVTAVSASKGWNLPGLACAQLIMTNPEHLRRWGRTPLAVRHGTSPLGAVAAVAAYSDDGVRHLDQLVTYLDGGRRLFARTLADVAPQIRYAIPQATYIHWLDLRPLDVDPQTVADRVGVLGTDGAECGLEGFLRLTLATSQPIAQEIATRFGRLTA
ncbi:MalY/PatB family protein [Leekyejoonella antrihumi]|uniref:cysteine-S-conjugate beta-lyase n=1 Tax=Leekyejoonella antrihumi TaxID=1660198 RepID=A0A563DZZ5_9MICO|nr:aminotransferase class I/II-fold pyridoxal phosphate-dependent enzyme [Leekyejoonella antrihumi]TWP35214.1 aminotransferase class I/II-fold pyridoxal phosphate-dependent enzyme [Leekyejoonella antrihumi]